MDESGSAHLRLIVNARDAMPNGGWLVLETQHTWETREDEQAAPEAFVTMNVIDSGTGMSPEVRARLFEPFFTTKPTGRGTGLGLAMCHGIVTQARGHISVSSEPGRGTRFRIDLPRQLEPVADVAATPAVTRPNVLGHETVLLVEDEAMILRVAKTALERRGYRVLCASNGAEALDVALAADARIDLLVTDVVMPMFGGPELALRLCELRPGLKVLYTSGYPENALSTQGVLRDGVHFIQKPYALAQLAQRVRELLDHAA